MTLTPAQKIIAKDRHRFRVLNCGRRFGKTTLATEEIKGKALSKPSRISYIAPTYQQSRDIAWQILLNELKPIIKKVNESRLELTVHTTKGGESLIQLRGWESIETLRGQKFDLLILDEVAMMRNYWINWEEVIRPTLTDTKGEAMFISTPKGFNHFYDLYNKEKSDSDYKSFHFTSYDNPYLPIEELDKAKEEIPEDRFAQEYLADFRKTEGLVYPEFDRDRHVVKELPEIMISEWIAGVDFGYTNPTAIVKMGIDQDHNYWITDEWYKTQQTNPQIIEAIGRMGINAVYPDPEAPDKIQELQNAGINCREVVKGKDSVINGINKVRELFKQGKIKILNSCGNLIWELETYRYPDKKPDKNENELPIKENDHAVDAMRYALTNNVPVNPRISFFEEFNIQQNRDNKRSFK